MNKRIRTESRKSNTSSSTMRSRLKKRRQAKIDLKAAESRVFKSVPRNQDFKKWTTQEHKDCMKAFKKYGPKYDQIAIAVKTRNGPSIKGRIVRLLE